jgi:hypothetical protein
MNNSPILRLATTAAACVVLTVAAHAADAAKPVREPGDLWEVTSTMSMEGMDMAMPGMSQKVCAAREWSKPPVGNDDRSNCEVVDFKNTPTKTTWKMRCTGAEAMTGEGEITRTSPEAYNGWMKMTSDQGVMKMTIAGRRVGDCDAAESKRQMAQMQARAETQAAEGQKLAADMQKQACNAPLETMDLRTMKAQASYCEGPTYKDAFCKRLDTAEGYKLVCERREQEPENGYIAAAAFCGGDAEARTKRICDEALEKEILDLLEKCCISHAGPLAQRECAGRKYTSMIGSKYASFCATYAREVMAGGQKDEAAEPETGKSKTKKLLKGIFSR